MLQVWDIQTCRKSNLTGQAEKVQLFMGIKLNATKHCTRVDTTSQDEDNQYTAIFGDMQEAPLEQQRHQPFL
jgi:hypothetical protein